VVQVWMSTGPVLNKVSGEKKKKNACQKGGRRGKYQKSQKKGDRGEKEKKRDKVTNGWHKSGSDDSGTAFSTTKSG